jgi:dTDP-4-amino-4,6-dideoxygalactose transaminase
MFGCPARIGEIEAHCRAAGVFLVDDAAQVVGERSEGRLLGTFGDVGIVSFAQSKAVVTGVRGSGGVLLVNNPALDDGVRQAWKGCRRRAGAPRRLPTSPGITCGTRYTGNSGYYLARLRSRLGGARKTAPQPARIANLDAAIALAQLRAAGRDPRGQDRRAGGTTAPR